MKLDIKFNDSKEQVIIYHPLNQNYSVSMNYEQAKTLAKVLLAKFGFKEIQNA